MLMLKFGTKIVVVKKEKWSPEEELVKDLISITHVFSCRVYGLRKYKNQLKEEKQKCMPIR
jgi:putative resolvase